MPGFNARSRCPVSMPAVDARFQCPQSMPAVHACCSLLSVLDHDALDVHEFVDAGASKLPSIARALDTAERQAWIGSDHAVDEDEACLQLVDEAVALGLITGPGGTAEAVDRV